MNFRRMNYNLDTPPPGPVPTPPKIVKATPGDTTAVVEWTYASNDPEVDHWDLYLYEGFALLAVIRVEGPGTRSHTLGELTNEITYSVELQAVNLNGHSSPSNRVDVKPEGLKIKAPEIISVTGKDGYISYSFREGKDQPGTVTGHKYIAKRTDSGYEFEGDANEDTSIIGHTGPVDNDRTYRLYLATVIEGGKVGPYSEASAEVTPSNPIPPYAPVWAHIDANKWSYDDARGRGCDWLLTIGAGVKNVQADAGPQNITGYRWQIIDKATGTTVIDRTMNTSQQSLSVSETGGWIENIAVMTCWARNNDGWSEPTTIEFDTTPHAELPIDFGVFQEIGGYRYHYAEDDVQSYAKVNKRGVGLKLECLIVGAAGSGQGRTTLGKTGGNGGAGEYIFKTITPFNTGALRAKIGEGSKYTDSKIGGDSYLSVDSQAHTARGGGNASGVNDGSPNYTPTAVQVGTLMPGAEELRIWFWNKPYSSGIGGHREWDKNNPPDGNLYGQAGGGTNSSGSNHGGNGGPGVVCIRYKLSDVPPADPTFSKWGEWRHRRFEKRLARQIRRTRVRD